MFMPFKHFRNIYGPLTWCRHVYLLRTTVRLCHRNSTQPIVQNQQEGGASATGSIQSDVSAPNENDAEDNRSRQQVDVSRGVGKFQDEQTWRYLMKPDQPHDARVLRVAIIGAPNAGKSTLVNNLIRWKANPVSTKVHTTRKNTLGLFTEGNTQIIFTDTPGVITAKESKKHHCERSLAVDPRRSVEQVDLVGVLVDVSNRYTRGVLHREILKILVEHKHIPSVLILNKVDELGRKDVLLGLIKTLTEGEVGGSNVSATPIRKPSKKKKEFKEIFNELEEKYGKFTIKKKKDSKKAENIIPPLASETETIDNSLKRTGEQSLNDLEQKLDKVITGFNEKHCEDTSGHHVLGADSNKMSINGMEQNNSVEIFQTLSENLKSDSEHMDDVESDRALADTHTNNQTHNAISEHPFVQSVDQLHSEDVWDHSLDIDSEKFDLRKDQSLENSERLENESCKSLDDETDSQMASLEANEADTEDLNVEQSELKTNNDDDHTLGKVDNDSSKTSWEKLMPRDEEIKRGWPHFNQVFIVSSLYGEGTRDLKTYLLDNAQEGNWDFHSSLVTDEDPFQLARHIVWSKLLDHVKGYIAYQISPEIAYWQIDEDGILKIVMNIPVKHMDKMIGSGGTKIGVIAGEARQALMDAFRCEVKLKLVVKRILNKRR